MRKKRLPDNSIFCGTGSPYDIGGADLWDQMQDIGALPVGASADVSLRRNRDDAIQTSRHLDQNNFLVQGAMNRAQDHVLGPGGITPQPNTGIDGVDQQIEEEVWGPAAENPEITGRFSWHELQRHIFRETWIAGDIVMSWLGRPRKGNTGRWQAIKAERIRGHESKDDDGRRVEQGRVLNSRGQTVAWRAAGISDWGYLERSEHDELAARYCDYFHHPYRSVDQHRGYPGFMCVKPLAMQISDIVRATAIRAQVESRLMAAEHNEDEDRRPSLGDDNTRESETSARSGQASNRVTDFGFATIFQAKKGQKLEFFKQSGAGGNFVQNMQMYISLFCLPLGLAREILMLDFGDMNYSNFRGMLLQAFINFRRQQMRVVEATQAFYRRQIDLALADGRLAWRPSIYDHTMDIPGWPWIDENKEVKAWAEKIDRGIATQREALASLGKSDVEEHRQNRKEELIRAAELAGEVEEKTGGLIQKELIWKTFAGLDFGKTEEAKLAESLRSKDAANTDEEGE